MSFWDDVLALNPAMLWKLDEESGTEATDATGNGRHGTYPASNITKGHDSIIPGEPESTSAQNTGGNNSWVTRNHEAWMNVGAGSFTAMITARPSSTAAQRDVFGKVEMWQIWLESNGRFTGHLTPPWSTFGSSPGSVEANKEYLLFLRRDAGTGKGSLWINGLKVAEINHTATLTSNTQQLRAFGSSIGNNRSFPGRQAGAAYWPGVALTDVQIEALYDAWSTEPTVPALEPPGAFTSPQNESLQTEDFIAQWGASASDPEDLTYCLEISSTGSEPWTLVADEIELLQQLVAIAGRASGDSYKLRVRAEPVDPQEFSPSAWTVSDTFTIARIPTTPGSFLTFPVSTLDRIAFVLSWEESSSLDDPTLPLSYRLQISDDGVDWTQLQFSPSTEYQLDPVLLPDGEYEVRVRAETEFAVSGWLVSGTFEVLHDTTPPGEPGLALLEWSGERQFQLTAAGMTSSIPGDSGTITWQRRRRNEEEPAETFIGTLRQRFVYGGLDAGLVHHFVRYRWTNLLGINSPWSKWLYIRRGREYMQGSVLSLNSGQLLQAQGPISNGLYGRLQWIGSFIFNAVPSFVMPSYPERVVTRGANFRYDDSACIRHEGAAEWSQNVNEALEPCELTVFIKREAINTAHELSGIIGIVRYVADTPATQLGIYVDNSGALWVARRGTSVPLELVTGSVDPIHCGEIDTTPSNLVQMQAMPPFEPVVLNLDTWHRLRIKVVKGFEVSTPETLDPTEVHLLQSPFNEIIVTDQGTGRVSVAGPWVTRFRARAIDPPDSENPCAGYELIYRINRGIEVNANPDELRLLVGRADNIASDTAVFEHGAFPGSIRAISGAGYGQTFEIPLDDRPAPATPLISLVEELT